MEKQNKYEAYLNATHRLGRIASVLTLVLLLGAPFLIGNLLGTAPDLGAAARGFVSGKNSSAFWDSEKKKQESGLYNERMCPRDEKMHAERNMGHALYGGKRMA